MKQQIGKTIRNIREERNITPNELALKLGVSLNTIYNWESGKTLPTTELLPQLSIVLNTSIDDIISSDKTIHLKKLISNYYFDLNLDDYKKALEISHRNKDGNKTEKMTFDLMSLEMTHILHQAKNYIEKLDEFLCNSTNLPRCDLFKIFDRKIVLEIAYYGANYAFDAIKTDFDSKQTINNYYRLIRYFLSTGQSKLSLRYCNELKSMFDFEEIHIIDAECYWKSGDLELATERLWSFLINRARFNTTNVINAHEMLYRVLVERKNKEQIVKLIKYSQQWLPEEYEKIGYDAALVRKKIMERLLKYS